MWSTLTKLILMGFAKGVTKAQAQNCIFNKCECVFVCAYAQYVRLLMLFWRLSLSSSFAFPFVNLNCYVCVGIAARLTITFYIIIFRLSSIHPFEAVTIKKITRCRTKFVNKLIEQHKWKQMTLFLYYKLQGEGFVCQISFCLIKYEIYLRLMWCHFVA